MEILSAPAGLAPPNPGKGHVRARIAGAWVSGAALFAALILTPSVLARGLEPASVARPHTAITQTVTVTLSAPSVLTVGGRTALVIASAVDEQGQPVVDGTPISLTVSAGEISPSAGGTVSGTLTATLTSAEHSGPAVLTAVAGEVQTTTQVVYVADVPAALQVVASSSSVVGRSVEVLARVADAYGNPAGDGTRLTWATTRGSVDPDWYTIRNGEARTTLRGLATGSSRLTAALPGGLRAETIVSWLPGPTTRLDVVPTTARIPVDGQTDVTITGLDAYGNVAADSLQVQLSGSGGTVRPTSVVLQTGRASARYLADELPGDFEVAAASGGLAGSGYVSVRPADLGVETIVRGPRGKVPEEQIHPGDLVRFEVTVRNADLATARGVVLGVVLPDALIEQRVESTATVFTRSRGPSGLIESPPEGHHTRFWDLPDLADQVYVTLTISGRIDASREWNGLDNVFFRAAATSSTVEASLGDLTRGRLVAVQAADMFVVADLDYAASVLRPGGVAVLDVGFGNQFRTTDLNQVTITSTLPTGLSFEQWQPGLGATGITPVGQLGPESRELAWRVAPEHAAGGTLRLWLAIDPETPPEAVLPLVTGISSDVYEVLAENNVTTRVIALRGVNLETTIQAPSEAAPGDEIDYHVALRNVAQRDPASDVHLTVRPPAGASNVQWSAGGIAGPNGTVTWNVGSLGAGGRVEFEVTLQAPEAAAVGSFLQFAAEATGAETDSYPPDNSALAPIRVVPGEPSMAQIVQLPVLEACDPQPSEAQARILDRFGNPVRDGLLVDWTVSSGEIVDTGTTTGGIATASVVAGRDVGAANIEVSVGGASGQATLDVAEARLGALAVTVRPRIAATNGTARVTVNALNRCSQAVADGALVRLTTERGSWGGQRQITLETSGGQVASNLQVGSDVGPLRIQARSGDVFGETILSVVPPDEVPTPTPEPGSRVLLPLLITRRVR